VPVNEGCSDVRKAVRVQSVGECVHGGIDLPMRPSTVAQVLRQNV
jgi:hypothetical protein